MGHAVIGRALTVWSLCAMSLGGLLVGLLWPEHIIASGTQLFEPFRDLGGIGILLFGLAQIAVAVTGLLPASLLGVIAGAVYGLAMGFVVAAVSTMSGAMLAFLISRSMLRNIVEQMLVRRATLRKHDTSVARGGWRLVCLLRVSPVMPFAVTSYALGLSSISFRDYVIGTLGSLPALFAYVVLGTITKAGLAAWSSGAGPLRWALLGISVGTLLLLLRTGWLLTREIHAPVINIEQSLLHHRRGGMCECVHAPQIAGRDAVDSPPSYSPGPN
jgi:uncharacterized membrane protein YdjX (TVP38/TMEM64 family)